MINIITFHVDDYSTWLLGKRSPKIWKLKTAPKLTSTKWGMDARHGYQGFKSKKSNFPENILEKNTWHSFIEHNVLKSGILIKISWVQEISWKLAFLITSFRAIILTGQLKRCLTWSITSSPNFFQTHPEFGTKS